MKRTQHYQLSQWEKSDKVLMEDFNADNAKIDAAIRAEADTRAAAVRAVNEALGEKIKMAAGTYTGDGQESRFISLGFTPKVVILVTNYGVMYDDGCMCGGIAFTGHPVGNGAQNAVEIAPGGFNVSFYQKIQSNIVNFKYHYVAFA